MKNRKTNFGQYIMTLALIASFTLISDAFGLFRWAERYGAYIILACLVPIIVLMVIDRNNMD